MSACFYRGRLPVSSLSTVEGNPYAPTSTVEIRNIVMPDYLVRVEIFKANSEEYTGLHEGMEALGLKRTIQGHRATSKLPTGTYYGTSQLEAEALSKRVIEVATPFSLPSDPLVIVSQSVTWSGWLEPV